LTGEEDMGKYKLEWSGLEDDQKASIAVELLTEILEDVDQYIKLWDEYPEWSNKKDYKAMDRVRDTLVAHYGIPSGG
jgi:hypothetical protein